MTIDHLHPGFSDPEYRQRRDSIAAAARNWSPGQPTPEVVYTLEEDCLWSDIWHELAGLYPTRAVSAYQRAWADFGLMTHRVPQFSHINARLQETGFALAPVEGLVDSRRFLSGLSEGEMLCTQYIRHHSVPRYTPEPDIIHEIFGHAVFFLDPSIRRLNKLFGQVARSCPDSSLESLERLYWYTIEFGLCMESGSVRAYGAGLLSSIDELSNIDSIEHRPFDIEEIISTPYDTQSQHVKLFCAESFDQAVSQTAHYLEFILSFQ